MRPRAKDIELSYSRTYECYAVCRCSLRMKVSTPSCDGRRIPHAFADRAFRFCSTMHVLYCALYSISLHVREAPLSSSSVADYT